MPAVRIPPSRLARLSGARGAGSVAGHMRVGLRNLEEHSGAARPSTTKAQLAAGGADRCRRGDCRDMRAMATASGQP